MELSFSSIAIPISDVGVMGDVMDDYSELFVFVSFDRYEIQSLDHLDI